MIQCLCPDLLVMLHVGDATSAIIKLHSRGTVKRKQNGNGLGHSLEFRGVSITIGDEKGRNGNKNRKNGEKWSIE